MTLLLIGLIIVSVLITGSILLQAQGSGLGSTWGGGGETYHTRRGIEKVVFYATIGLTALFSILATAIHLI